MNEKRQKADYFKLIFISGLTLVILWTVATAAPQGPETPLSLVAPPPETNTESYRYDAAGRLTQVLYEDGHILQYTYDDTGNIVGVEVFLNPIHSDGFEQ